MASIVFDLETLDVTPTSTILSIGACYFDYTDPPNVEQFLSMKENGYYVKLDVASQRGLGRTVSKDTVDWWRKQNKEAQALVIPNPELDITLKNALDGFNEWAIDVAKFDNNSDLVWNRGMFDAPIIEDAYRNVGVKPVFSSFRYRCARTYCMALTGDEKGLYLPSIGKPKGFIYHCSLDDSCLDAIRICELTQKFYDSTDSGVD